MSDYKNEMDKYLLSNFRKMASYLFVVYPSLYIMDCFVLKRFQFMTLLLRILSVLPIPLALLYVKKSHTSSTWSINICFMVLVAFWTPLSFIHGQGSFFTPSETALLIFSFAQMAFFPMSKIQVITFDIFCILSFYVPNLMRFPHLTEEILTGLSTFITFLVFKFMAISKSREFIAQALKSKDLEKSLKEEQKTKIILGELCHLMNNPLIISNGNLKKIIKKGDQLEYDDLQRLVEKSFDANKRIAGVLNEVHLTLNKSGSATDEILEKIKYRD